MDAWWTFNGLIPPHVLAGYCAQTYSGSEPTWRFRDLGAYLFWHPDADGHVPVIAFRGTVPTDIEDWACDFEAWPAWRPKLGFCHDGFLEGATALRGAIGHDLEDPIFRRVALTGHSLGWGLASLFAAMEWLDGFHVAQLTGFNGPRPGGRKIGQILRGVPTQHYRWRGDVVSEVPWAFGLYAQPVPPITIGNELEPIAAHSIANFTNPGVYYQ